jgi:hypothetical protein
MNSNALDSVILSSLLPFGPPPYFPVRARVVLLVILIPSNVGRG